MRLHTKDQAPKEGQRESAEKAWKQVQRLITFMGSWPCLRRRVAVLDGYRGLTCMA